MAHVWTCSGLRWSGDGPALVWGGGAVSALGWGKRVAFGVAEGGARVCVGARGHACPVRAVVPGRSTGARCDECARLDRAHSVAADTIADDPRPYHVYLAWFGPGMVKVGITAVERGPARLLEQGAVCFSWLGAGPLMAARRTEELLRAALGVPDRIPYGAKRAVRSALPGTPDERAAEIADLHDRAAALGGWPEALDREPFRPVDHAEVFGLEDDPRPAFGEVSELVAGGSVSGELVAAAGPDLHLATGRGVVVIDTRLMTGWELVALGGAAEGGLALPVRRFREEIGVQDQLF
ncbi:DUF2797 domain-containing protein [Streptomyces brasiliensis]|uniref:DUF2797 domain-containing protein n=1 Tax=Streptomyces brasiliensis TaxID=1954 RepID=A0A917KLC2_9ACTN|nr:DUF2797 domain-containing protein [Streptomyces brasiliensis]GGJ14162.1 hypothetical protein GCM10010121_025950 [Streptomyces brasiliensis]